MIRKYVRKEPKKFFLEYWVHQTGDAVRVTERNPCGCHPDDYLLFITEKNVVSWCGVSRKRLFALMRDRGFVRLP